MNSGAVLFRYMPHTLWGLVDVLKAIAEKHIRTYKIVNESSESKKDNV